MHSPVKHLLHSPLALAVTLMHSLQPTLSWAHDTNVASSTLVKPCAIALHTHWSSRAQC